MFSDILGQHKAVAYLQKLVCQDRTPGALLFCGVEGIGKRKTALEFAKALNCEDYFSRQNGQACGVCSSCVAIDKGTHPDVTLVDFLYQARLNLKDNDDPEALEKELAKQQHLSVETIRSVTAKAQQKSARNGWKVLIIDQAQTLQSAAANALLKFIEEPPAKTVWILITSKQAAMLGTIRSRCQPLLFAPLSQAHVEQLLKIHAPDIENPARAAQYSGGSVAGALQAAQALDLLEEGNFGAPTASVQIAGELSRTAATARREAQAVLDVLINALHRKWTVADETHRPVLQATLNKLAGYKRSIARNVSPALVLETALMNLDGIELKI